MSETLALFEIGFKQEDQVPALYLFCRNQNLERKIIKITSFYPYFYSLIEIDSYSIKEVEKSVLKTIWGEECYKITLWKVNDVPKFRKLHFEKTGTLPFEADIPFRRRFLISTGITGAITIEEGKVVPAEPLAIKPRVCLLDIEVAIPALEPLNAKAALFPVVLIGFFDTYTGERVIYSTKEVSIPQIKTIKCDNEKALLFRFVREVRRRDFDIITSWNIDFDIEYLLSRMERLKLPISSISPIHQVYRKKGRSWRIGGRALLDFMTLYKKLHKGELTSFKLENVIEKERLPYKKIVIDDFAETWEKNPEKVLERNFNDVMALKALDEKYDILNFFEEVRKEVGCLYEDVAFSSTIVDTYLLRDCFGKVVLPSKGEEGEESYEGAEILKAVRGFHREVLIFDFKRAYPNIIISFNLSPETLIRSKEKLENTLVISSEFQIDLSKEGILPRVVKKLLKRREEKERELELEKDKERIKVLTNQVRVIKYTTNSVYGVLAYSSFRLYNKDLAGIITYLQRELLKLAKKEAEKSYEVVGGHTDSIFIKIGNNFNDWLDLKIAINRKVQQYLFARFHLEKSYIELDLARFFDRFFIKEKTLYAGIMTWKDKEIEPTFYFAGFGNIRSDTSAYTSEKLEGLIKRILLEQERSLIIDYVKEAIKPFKLASKGKIKLSIEKIAIPTRLKKKPEDYPESNIQRKAAENSLKYLNLKLEKGQKFYRVYCISPAEVLGFFTPSILKNVKIDYAKMLERSFKPKINGVLELIGIKWEEVQPFQESLETFFNDSKKLFNPLSIS